MADKEKELFFPYYVNQSRLLDIYAILNGGYSEYEEVSVLETEEKSKTGKGKATASTGFKMFKISADAEVGMDKTNSTSEGNKVKKVQTVTSILSLVVESLKKKYIKDILESTTGSFVLIPVNVKINSVKAMFDELSEIISLVDSLGKIGVNTSFSKAEAKQYLNLSKSIKTLFNGEEILFEKDDFAVFGNISSENFYQATYDDIIGADLMCLAQVKRVFPNGTELMRNTVFTKFKDQQLKTQLTDGIKSIGDKDTFDFDSTAVLTINDKPVYQIEIIAMYQTEQ